MLFCITAADVTGMKFMWLGDRACRHSWLAELCERSRLLCLSDNIEAEHVHLESLIHTCIQ